MKSLFLIMIGFTLVQAEFLRDNVKDIVLDTRTNLMWQDFKREDNMNWESAIKNCEDSTHAEFNDWRLPNINELQSIVDYTLVDPAMSLGFKNIVYSNKPKALYWSSSTYMGKHKSAWTVNFKNGQDTYGSLKTKSNYVCCVR